jgi:GNAT superfamily N-acetyltransferase
MIFRTREVAARRDRLLQEQIRAFNAMAPETFPALQDRHFQTGHWWLVYSLDESEPVAFAGMVPFEPFPLVGYLKRAFVIPTARGHGLQRSLLEEREAKARQLGWTTLVSECAADNHPSAANFQRAGFTQFEPEQRWGAPNSLYWKKDLAV